jgi:hypothetical protein
MWGQEWAKRAVFSANFNGTDRTRTGDPGLMNPSRYQLSHSASAAVAMISTDGVVSLLLTVIYELVSDGSRRGEVR